MKNKKYLIIFLLIILVGLSGCVELITTQEKQACLALTHFSSTSIEGCLSQNSCFSQVENIGFYSSEYLPYNIYNTLLAYKNHIGSSYYYYTKTSKLLEKINTACKTDKPKEILDNINLSRFYFSESFNYLDKTSKESINLITEYAIYLESQEINLIPEEPIFEDYITLNQNINDLKDQKNTTTYISKLNLEIKNLYTYAKDIGFRENYLVKENISDLSAYYLEIYQEEINSYGVQVPEIFKIGNYVLGAASNIEDFDRINKLANKLDSYNYYLLIDKFIGKENSLTTNFLEINNKINYDLDLVYTKINSLEIDINIDLNYLEEENIIEFKTNKNNFKDKKISFGYYLLYLKNTQNKIAENKLNSENINLSDNNKLLECDTLIEELKSYTNLYFKENITNYQKTTNLLEKKNICFDLNKMANYSECNNQIDLFLKTDLPETKDFELYVFDNNKQCIELIGNINFILKNNEKIILLNKLITETLTKTTELKINTDNYIDLEKIITINEQLKLIDNQDSIQKIINIDEKIKELIKNNAALNEIANHIIEQDFNQKYISIDQNYLIIINPFSFKLTNLLIPNNYIGLVSENNKLTTSNKLLTISELYAGKNYFKIKYSNIKKIDYTIKYLTITDSIIEIIIKNDVEGILDQITFLQNFKTTDPNIQINGSTIRYITEKENKIYLTGNVFEIEKQIYVEEITTDKYILLEKYTLTNNFPENINQKIELMDFTEDELVLIYINDKEETPIIENNKIKLNLELKIDESVQINLQKIENKEQVYILMDSYLNEIKKYNLSAFEDIKNEINKYFVSEINKQTSIDYTLDEIKSMYSKLNLLEEIRTNHKLCENAETKYFIKYNQIDQNQLITKELVELNKIDISKYKNIRLSENQISTLIEKIQTRKNTDETLRFEENIDLLNSQKELIEKYSLTEIDFDKLLNTKDVNQIELIITDALKTKAEEIYYLINPITNGLDSREITELITKIYKLYQDYTLRDLYSINYFSGITENDAKRLEKNIAFLDGVLFNKEMTDFEEYYESKNYSKAIDAISLETINRINKIKADKSILEEGYDIIKNDAKNEIITYQKNSYDVETLELAKTNYDNEKYLNTIVLLKNQNAKNTDKSKLKPTIISLLIIILFAITYSYLRLGKKKKEESIKSKKKKIIRR